MAKKTRKDQTDGADLSNPPFASSIDDGGGIAVGAVAPPAIDRTDEGEDARKQRLLAESLERGERAAARLRDEDEIAARFEASSAAIPAPAPDPRNSGNPAVRRAALATNGAASPDKPRAVFYVISKDADGDYTDVLSIHKTKRRAQRWLRENAAMIRRYCAHVKVFRAKEA